MQMNSKIDWLRKLLSVAVIASGIYFLIANHLRVNSDSFALGAELGHWQSAQSFEAPPAMENAKTESRALSGSLADEISRWAKSSSDPQWLGYAVPAISGNRVICCGNGDWNGSY